MWIYLRHVIHKLTIDSGMQVVNHYQALRNSGRCVSQEVI